MGPSPLFNHRIECPVVIGRGPALSALERALDEARAGHGQTWVLAGEAGIGKSRLVAEAKSRTRPREMLILQGHCFEPDRVLPFAPLLDLLRTRFTGRSAIDIAHDLGPTAHELVKLLPELATRLPDLAPTPAVEPEQEKRRLFQALTEFFTRLVARQPLLVIVEDLHWSDDTSLEFLLHLARRVLSQPILLLTTYRNDEVNPSLSHFLAEVDRARLATELVLGRLTMEEVDAMIRAIFDQQRPVRAEFLEPIYALTEGNPFFVEEVLKSLVAAGEIFRVGGGWDRKPMGELHIPRSVQDAVQRRLAHLSPAAGELLVLAAVAGRHFDFALLEELTQMNEEDLLERLKEGISARLIVEESADEFAFRHTLTQEAVYTSLLIRERRRLHRVVGETLERLYAKTGLKPGTGDPHISDLAYHFYQAQAWDKVLEYAPRAAERAQAMYAPRAAIEQFTRALEAADHLATEDRGRKTEHVGPRSSVLRPLYRARGQAYETLGDFERARADHEAALQLARSVEDRQMVGSERERGESAKAEWQALLDLGFLWASRDYSETGAYFRQALALARELGDPAILGHSLNRLGNWHLNLDQPFAALRYHQEALGIFEELRDQHGLAETLDLLGLATSQTGDLSQSIAHYRRAVALFRELDERRGLASSLISLAEFATPNEYDTWVMPVMTRAEVLAQAEQAIKLARDIGWRSGEAYASLILGMCLASYGEYGRASAVAQEGLAIAEDIEHRQWITAAHAYLGLLHFDLFTLSEAEQHLEQALALANEIGSVVFSQRVSAYLALAYIVQGELARAESVLNAAVGHYTLDDAALSAQTNGQRLHWCARAELALAQGHPDAALQIIERLLVSVPNLSEGRIILRVSRLRGEALAALYRWAEAEAELRAVRDGALAQGILPVLWRIHVALGNVYRAQRRYEEAESEFVEARMIIEDLAAGVPDGDLRETFLRNATALIPSTSLVSPRRALKKEYGGLTERERQVAALIAQGKSNHEIAQALVLADRTVAAHVGNILAKLGFTSRTQIVAWAIEKGLAWPTSS